MFGDQLLLMEDAEGAGIERLAHDHGPSGMNMRDRVAVAAVGHQAVLRYLAMAHVAGVVGWLAVEGCQSFMRKTHLRDLAGGRMHPAVRLSAPDQRLPVQLLKRIEAQTGPEAALDIADRRLDLALGLGTVRMADARDEAIVAGEVQHPGMKAGLPVDPVEHHRLHVV